MLQAVISQLGLEAFTFFPQMADYSTKGECHKKSKN